MFLPDEFDFVANEPVVIGSGLENGFSGARVAVELNFGVRWGKRMMFDER